MHDQPRIEVELRVKVEEALVAQLLVTPHTTATEHDEYFRHVSDSARTWIARIRRQDERYALTLKSSTRFGEGAWDEVNLPLTPEQAAQLRPFLLAHSFDREVTIAKRRRTFRQDGMAINLDTIDGLGTYLEAEILAAPGEVAEARRRIGTFFATLGIDEAQITQDGYVRLMREHLAAKG